ncbi:hypothetical protein G4V62_13930 [Bacillaceae bacterium SIJ1]|nr:hypothetical protein [Litoribacterium kuwaitense]NGP45994.1 hypothetical protein [Litoribacterium kuwaitense]
MILSLIEKKEELTQEEWQRQVIREEYAIPHIEEKAKKREWRLQNE